MDTRTGAPLPPDGAPDSDLILDNPYPGLRPFQADEIHLFFGRDAQRTELLRRLRDARFLAVIGGSGSGKSSLVRAGLLPGLHGGLMGDSAATWRIADLRPGRDPLGNLVAALDKPGVLRDTGLGEDDMSFTDATLRRSSLGLVAAVREARLPDNERVLVLVDQFEELFRVLDAREGAQVEADANAFVSLLLEAAAQTDVPIYVVLTMRSDFLGECARFQGLPEAINGGQYLIPRLTREQRREAIVGPAAVHGATLSPPLLNRLLNDVGDNPDQLPLLQHALMRTWDLWVARADHGGTIGIEDYERTGGMADALSSHAELVLKAFVGDAGSEAGARRLRLVERVFRSLVSQGRNGRAVRRLATLQEIADVAGAPRADVAAVVEVFRAQGASFLMPPPAEPLLPSSTVDITHESLIRNWKSLIGWYRREVESGRVFERLATTAALHDEQKAELLRGTELDVGLAWRKEHLPTAAWAARYATNFEQAMEFLDDSAEARASAQASDDVRRRRGVALAVAGVVLLFIVALQWVAGNYLQAKPWDGIVDREDAETLASVIERRSQGVPAANIVRCWQDADETPSVLDKAGAAAASNAMGLRQEAADGVPQSPFEVAMRYACDPEREKLESRRLVYAESALRLAKGDFDGFQMALANIPLREGASVLEQILKVLDSDPGAILDEGRRLAAWAAQDPKQRKAETLDVRHPAHIAIRDALAGGGTLAPGKGPDVLLRAYANPSGKDSVCNGKLFSTRDDRNVEWTTAYRRMARDIACRPSLNIATVTQRLQPYALSLLMLLAWPVWKVLRWTFGPRGTAADLPVLRWLRLQALRWQRPAPDDALDAPVQAWRRAAAALFDGAFAGVLFGAVTLMASSLFDELLFRGVLPFGWIDAMLGVAIAIGAAVAVAYLLTCDALLIRYSRSLGKIAFDLRPVPVAGPRRLGVWGSVRRNLLATATLVLVSVSVVMAVVVPGASAVTSEYHGLVIFGVFLLLTAGYHWRARTLGDRWSGTRVVDADSRASKAADALPRYLSQGAPAAPAVRGAPA